MSRYERTGLLAIDPRAFTLVFTAPASRKNTSVEGATIVDVRGPIDARNGGVFDSYEDIIDRVCQACDAQAPTIILRIDSPGGDASGMVDAVRDIRGYVQAAGKTLIAYVDGQACSAGYALATAASRVVVSSTGIVGSVGVISARVDVTRATEAQGIGYTFITSGARKADGNPHTPITDSEKAATQTLVDGLAAEFFALVSESRPLAVDQIQALEAGLFNGSSAVSVGLADEVSSLSSLLSRFKAGASKSMATIADTRAALEEIAKGDSEEAAAAKRALKALDESESEETDKEDKEEPKAESEEEDEPKASVSAATAGAIATHASTLEARLAALELERESDKRSALLASRPDLPAGLVKVLASQSFAEVERIVSAIEKPKAPKLAASTVVNPTVGADIGDDKAPRLNPTDAKALARAMGLAATQSTGVISTPHTLTLGAPVAVKKVG